MNAQEQYALLLEKHADGVAVDARWLGDDGLANFVRDLGPMPHENYMLGRFPSPHFPYTVEWSRRNCHWALPENIHSQGAVCVDEPEPVQADEAPPAWGTGPFEGTARREQLNMSPQARTAHDKAKEDGR